MAEIKVLGPGCEPAGPAANTPRSPGRLRLPPRGPGCWALKQTGSICPVCDDNAVAKYLPARPAEEPSYKCLSPGAGGPAPRELQALAGRSRTGGRARRVLALAAGTWPPPFFWKALCLWARWAMGPPTHQEGKGWGWRRRATLSASPQPSAGARGSPAGKSPSPRCEQEPEPSADGRL